MGRRGSYGPYRGPATYVNVAGHPQIVVITNGVKVIHVDQYVEYGLKRIFFLKTKTKKDTSLLRKEALVGLNIPDP